MPYQDLIEAVLSSLFCAWVGWGVIYALVEGKLETSWGVCTRTEMPAGFWLMVAFGAIGAAASGIWACRSIGALLASL